MIGNFYLVRNLMRLRSLKAAKQLLYSKDGIRITAMDVADALTEAEERVGPELSGLLSAMPMAGEEENGIPLV